MAPPAGGSAQAASLGRAGDLARAEEVARADLTHVKDHTRADLERAEEYYARRGERIDLPLKLVPEPEKLMTPPDLPE